MEIGRNHQWKFQLSDFGSVKGSFPLLNVICPAFLPVFLFLCLIIGNNASFAQPSTRSSKKLLAPELFAQAVELRTSLEGKPSRLRIAGEYSKVINKFRSVYYEFPGSSKSDDSLLAVAELYQLMAEDFKDPKYFQQAIKAYAFLEREYPGSPFCAGALFSSAEIYLNDLNDTKSALEMLKDLLKKYPHSNKARNARARLDDLREQLKQARKSPAKPAMNEPLPVSTPMTEPGSKSASLPVESKEGEGRPLSELASIEPKIEVESLPPASQETVKKEVIRDPVKASSNKSNKPVIIENIRYWNTEDFTRLVVMTDSETQYSEGTLDSPSRVFLDLQNSRLSSQLAGKAFSTDGYLIRIRFGQVKEHVARIVLDVGEIKKYHIFSLYDPFRIVIDIQNPWRENQQAALNGSKSEWKIKRGEPLPDELMPPTFKKGLGPAERKRSEEIQVAEKSPNTKPKQPALDVSLEPRKSRSDLDLNDQKEKLKESRLKPSIRSDKGFESASSSRTASPKSDGTRSLIRTLGLKIGRIVIDPGHGGHDTGTIGPAGLQEKDLVLDISLKLKILIEEKLGGEVVLTRADDTFVPLEERTAIANQSQADLFISIHANSSRNRKVSGVETFFLNFATSPDVEEIAARENASSQKTVFELQDLVQKIALKEKVDESREFAHTVQKSVATHLQKTRLQTRDRGVKQAPFIVLIGANMPSILSEVSFVSNPADEKLLKSSNYRQKVAEALCRGIEDYIETLGGIKTAKNIR